MPAGKPAGGAGGRVSLQVRFDRRRRSGGHGRRGDLRARALGQRNRLSRGRRVQFTGQCVATALEGSQREVGLPGRAVGTDQVLPGGLVARIEPDGALGDTHARRGVTRLRVQSGKARQHPAVPGGQSLPLDLEPAVELAVADRQTVEQGAGVQVACALERVDAGLLREPGEIDGVGAAEVVVETESIRTRNENGAGVAAQVRQGLSQALARTRFVRVPPEHPGDPLARHARRSGERRQREHRPRLAGSDAEFTAAFIDEPETAKDQEPKVCHATWDDVGPAIIGHRRRAQRQARALGTRTPRKSAFRRVPLSAKSGKSSHPASTPTRRGDLHMPRYLIQASYNATAAAAFVSNPQDRVPGIRAAVEKLGGKLESFDFALGDYDVVGIGTFPDDGAAAALALAVNAAGHLKSYKTTRLMSADEFLAAQRKAHEIAYQAPKKA